MRYIQVFLLITFFFFLTNCQNGDHKVKEKEDITHIKKQVEKFVPVEVDFDRSILPENEMKALKKIVQAAQYMDIIFQKQVYTENDKIEKRFKRSFISHQLIFVDFVRTYNYFNQVIF